MVKQVKHQFKVLKMSIARIDVYQNIVKEDEYESAKKWLKNGIHSSLKGRWCVGQTKRHNNEFIMALVRAKGYFLNIMGVNSDLMIPSK